jgi:DNA-directed RNA polymerase specialized sigma24 family protein
MIQRLGGEEARKTLEELCEVYWPPLYGFARSQGWSVEDAEDLTQGFFAHLLETELFSRADRGRGSLRSFLLGAFKHYISEQRRNATRLKRGGGQISIPLDADALNCIERELADDPQSGEAEFDRRWYSSLLECAMADLEQEYFQRGQGERFEGLVPFLAWNRKDSDLAQAACGLGMSHGALRVAIVRMRHRLREWIEHHVNQTVDQAEQAAAEIANMRIALGSPR